MSDIWGNNEPFVRIACNYCKHYNRGDMTAFSCAAFENIPDEILNGDNDHSKPLPGQGNNIVFERKLFYAGKNTL